VDRRLIVEPSEAKFIVDTAEPNLAAERMLSEEPRLKKSRILAFADNIVSLPVTENPLPSLA
jgi:hypothetical protein